MHFKYRWQNKHKSLFFICINVFIEPLFDCLLLRLTKKIESHLMQLKYVLALYITLLLSPNCSRSVKIPVFEQVSKYRYFGGFINSLNRGVQWGSFRKLISVHCTFIRDLRICNKGTYSSGVNCSTLHHIRNVNAQRTIL